MDQMQITRAQARKLGLSTAETGDGTHVSLENVPDLDNPGAEFLVVTDGDAVTVFDSAGRTAMARFEAQHLRKYGSPRTGTFR